MTSPTFHDYSPIISGLILLEYSFHSDERGINFEPYNPETFKKCRALKDIDFKIVSESISKRSVCRGFHADSKNWKAVRVSSGEIYLVVLDGRKNSATYNNFITFSLKAEIPKVLILPPLVLNAHQVISETATFNYMLSEGYVPISEQISEKWNSRDFGWPIKNPILSDRDK